MIDIEVHVGLVLPRVDILTFYYRRPIGMLQGHISPVIFLNIDEGTHRLFSIALDKIIKV